MTLTTVLGIVLAMPPVSGSEIVINEIRIEQPGPDDDEYFELAGPPGASLDGFAYLVIGDNPGGTEDGTIEEHVDLSGLVIPADGYLLVAQHQPADLVVSLNFENCDNVTHLLVTGFDGPADADLDLDDDCEFDVTPWTTVVDLVALVKPAGPGREVDCSYGPPDLGPEGWGFVDCQGPDTDIAPDHAVRCTSGWVIGTAIVDTPGSSNGCETLPCLEDINGSGEVEVLDLVAIITSWGDPCADCPEDVNGDGDVGVPDLVQVITAWGPCP